MSKQAGEILLEEEPFAKIVSNAFLGKACTSCFKVAEKLDICMTCKYAWYCSEKCQEDDAETHRDECLVFKRAIKLEINMLQTQTFWEIVRLVGRIYSRKKRDQVVRENGFCIKYPTGMKHRNLEDLMGHHDHINEFAQMIWPVFQKVYTMSTFYVGVSWHEFLEYVGKFLTNPFYIYQYNKVEEKQTTGLALYLQASGFNHSCDPDLVPVYSTNPVRISMKLLKDFDPAKREVGDLRFLYGSFTTETTEERNEILKANHLFECDCGICKDQGMDHRKIQGLAEKCSKCQENMVADTSGSDIIIKCLLCNSSIKAPPDFEDEFNAAILQENEGIWDEDGDYVFEGGVDKHFKKLEKTLDPVRNVGVIRLREAVVEQTWWRSLEDDPRPEFLPIILNHGLKLAKSYEFCKVIGTDFPVLYGRLAAVAEKLGKTEQAAEYSQKAKDLWLKYFSLSDDHYIFQD